MSDPDLGELLEQYREGLDAELSLLQQLERVAKRQRAATTDGDLQALNRAADDRDRLMAGLVNIESQIGALRRTLSAAREQARDLPGYADAVAVHQQAVALVSRILETDASSIEALASAEMARREAARAVEHGETTLAAYRKVMTLAPGATLVDRRG